MDRELGTRRLLQFDPHQVTTPAFVYDTRVLRRNATKLRQIDDTKTCTFLFPLKAASVYGLASFLRTELDGLAASSLFEARFARDFAGIVDDPKLLHLTSPGLCKSEIAEISCLCNAISFNSLSQFNRLTPFCHPRCSLGLRLNPGLSAVRDPRCDPCRPHSKLGVPLYSLRQELDANPDMLTRIKGLHFHTNCEADDYSYLSRTVQLIADVIPDLLERVQWTNLGGGYRLPSAMMKLHFNHAVSIISRLSPGQVIFEPGDAIASSAGFMVASVVDLFQSGTSQVAILDTTVNHMPEVFEYGERPIACGECANGAFTYILAGCTCLPGDVFGSYRFATALAHEDKIVFSNMGTYTLVKAHMFNGVNLPTVYKLSDDGIECDCEYSYSDYLKRSGCLIRT